MCLQKCDARLYKIGLAYVVKPDTSDAQLRCEYLAILILLRDPARGGHEVVRNRLSDLAVVSRCCLW